MALRPSGLSNWRATVVGSVKNPGVYPLKGRTTLLQVVAGAGGTTSVATGTAAVLRSESDGTRKMLQYDLDAIRDGEAPDLAAGPVAQG